MPAPPMATPYGVSTTGIKSTRSQGQLIRFRFSVRIKTKVVVRIRVRLAVGTSEQVGCKPRNIDASSTFLTVIVFSTYQCGAYFCRLLMVCLSVVCCHMIT